MRKLVIISTDLAEPFNDSSQWIILPPPSPRKVCSGSVITLAKGKRYWQGRVEYLNTRSTNPI